MLSLEISLFSVAQDNVSHFGPACRFMNTWFQVSFCPILNIKHDFYVWEELSHTTAQPHVTLSIYQTSIHVYLKCSGSIATCSYDFHIIDF